MSTVATTEIRRGSTRHLGQVQGMVGVIKATGEPLFHFLQSRHRNTKTILSSYAETAGGDCTQQIRRFVGEMARQRQKAATRDPIAAILRTLGAFRACWWQEEAF